MAESKKEMLRIAVTPQGKIVPTARPVLQTMPGSKAGIFKRVEEITLWAMALDNYFQQVEERNKQLEAELEHMKSITTQIAMTYESLRTQLLANAPPE